MAPSAPTPTVLIVDDEHENVRSLERIFKREGMRVLTASSGREALEIVRHHRLEVMITDLMMPGVNGLELLRAVRALRPNVEVVLATAYGTVETAVQAMREGAYDFVEKPLKRMTIVKTVKKAAERHSLVVENESLRRQIKALHRRTIVGSCPAWRRTLEVAEQAARSEATVLVLGESGTGKELIARHIHEQSARANEPFVAVNCAALPETIMEAELFGHERGAYTGAHQRRDGRFKKADGGTLLLDEVGEIPASIQVKLLRVLQEGEYEPVGGDTTRANVRIVAATNRDLRAEVEAGRFREDLFYRLNVIAVTAPPLRARREDIPLLVDHFLDVYGTKNNRPRLSVPTEVMETLMDYPWPGNVRELENFVERATVLCRESSIQLADLPLSMRDAPNDPQASSLHFAIGTPLEEVERRLIRETLRFARGDKSVAAQLLGISTRTIYRKMAGSGDGIAGDQDD